MAATPVKKISEGSPNIIDLVRSGEIDLVLNTLSPERNPEREGARIRRASVEHSIPCLTSLDTARALLLALTSRQGGGDFDLLPIQEYVKMGGPRRRDRETRVSQVRPPGAQKHRPAVS